VRVHSREFTPVFRSTLQCRQGQADPFRGTTVGLNPAFRAAVCGNKRFVSHCQLLFNVTGICWFLWFVCWKKWLHKHTTPHRRQSRGGTTLKCHIITYFIAP